MSRIQRQNCSALCLKSTLQIIASKVQSPESSIQRVCSSDKMMPIYFLHLSYVWSIFYHGLVGRVHKKYYLMLLYTFSAFFVVFHHKICVLIIFIYFFDEVSNFRNRMLNNQKREMVVSNSMQSPVSGVQRPRLASRVQEFLYTL